MFSLFTKQKKTNPPIPLSEEWSKVKQYLLPLAVGKPYVAMVSPKLAAQEPSTKMVLSGIGEDIAFVIVMRDGDYTSPVTAADLDNWGVDYQQCVDQAYENYVTIIPEISMKIERAGELAFLNTEPDPAHDFVGSLIGMPGGLYDLLTQALHRDSYLITLGTRYSFGIFEDSEEGEKLAEATLTLFLLDVIKTRDDMYTFVSPSIYRLREHSMEYVTTIKMNIFEANNIDVG